MRIMKDIDEYAIISRAARLRAKTTAQLNPHYVDRKVYASASPKKISNTFLQPRNEYTGTYVIGIGTMHKSNSIPITSEQQAKDIARMRR